MGKKIMGMIVVLIATICMAIGISSCDRVYKHKHRQDMRDSIKLALAYEQYANPSLSDPIEFTKYAKDEVEYISFVDLCAGLDSRTIESIARQAIAVSRDGSITWKDFLSEFKAHETIYRNFDQTLSPPDKLSEYTKPKDPDDTLSSEEYIIQELNKSHSK